MTKDTKNYTLLSKKEIAGSQIELTISVPFTFVETFRQKALKSINENITLDGFRKGMIPENILVSKIGEMAILEEMAELAISRTYVEALIDNKIDAIGKPSVQINKLAKGNDLEFTAKTAVIPTLTLPDYKIIAKEVNSKKNPKDIEVQEKDIEDAILKIRRSKADHSKHDHDNLSKEEHDKITDADLPELTDDFVKSLGDFSDVPDFKNKLSQMIAEEKKDTAKDKNRATIADAIAEKTTGDIPDIMIEGEIDRIQSQFEADIERMGVKLEDYIKHAKKELSDIRKEWRPHAEKKAKLQIILNQIASKENIHPTKEELDEEVNHIVSHYKDADTERASVYAETVLTNEKVFSMLEGLQ
jgi:trigger factor